MATIDEPRVAILAWRWPMALYLISYDLMREGVKGGLP
jgi:hypothetical protein